MSKLIITRGISGSGKSTWARSQPNAVVISRDDLRELFFGKGTAQYYSRPDIRKCEEFISEQEVAMILAALASGKTVISDNTYIEWKFVRKVAHRAHLAGAEIEIKVFDVPLRQAQERDALRGKSGGRHVGGDIIKKQHARFQGSKDRTVEDLELFTPVPYKAPKNPNEVPAILVDIDGTLAHMGDRRGPFDWHKVGLDEPDDTIIELVNDLSETNVIIAMSGRDESCRKETFDWLNANGVLFDLLYMRPEKDMRQDSVIKDELFEKHIAGRYNVRFVLDDRNQVVQMWRKKGIKCLQVEDGDF